MKAVIDKIKKSAVSAYEYTAEFSKWIIIAALIGLPGGVIGAAFHKSIDIVTEMRLENPWVLFLLPAGGVMIAWLYRSFHMEGIGINDIIGSIRTEDRVSLRLLPLIFISTVITHLCGGSAGREGAALQLGGSLGNTAGRLFSLSPKDKHLATLCGMAAVFSALFGTPLAAAIFTLEVISVGLIYYSGLVPCLVSALTAYGVSVFLGTAPTRFALIGVPELGILELAQVSGVAAVAAVVSIVFCIALHKAENSGARIIRNPFLRAAAGGAVIIALTLLVGNRDYNGAGNDIITRAVAGEAVWYAFALKIIFTAVTIGAGFKGGEVVPTFFVGATLGCAVGPIFGLEPGFAAAIGLVAMFAGMVNCPIASTFLAIELFGGGGIMFFALACAVSYMLSGYYGLYESQKIMYSKLHAEYINVHVK